MPDPYIARMADPALLPNEQLAWLVMKASTLGELALVVQDLRERIAAAPTEEGAQLWRGLMAEVWPRYEAACEWLLFELDHSDSDPLEGVS
jgi:hypothetical protein